MRCRPRWWAGPTGGWATMPCTSPAGSPTWHPPTRPEHRPASLPGAGSQRLVQLDATGEVVHQNDQAGEDALRQHLERVRRCEPSGSRTFDDPGVHGSTVDHEAAGKRVRGGQGRHGRLGSPAHGLDVTVAEAESIEDRGVERDAIRVVDGDAHGDARGLTQARVERLVAHGPPEPVEGPEQVRAGGNGGGEVRNEPEVGVDALEERP